MGDRIAVDRKDHVQKALSGFGGRLGSLLGRKNVQANPHLVAALDDFLGALFSLLFARQGNFVDRRKQPIEVKVVVGRAEQLTQGSIKATGAWMAGFYFNSAILRLDGAYHRILKVVTGDPETGDRVKDLREKTSDLYQRWTNEAWSHENLDKVHGQVNKLKHSPKGVFYRRTAKYSEAMESVDELLTLAEAWSRRKKHNP